LPNEDYVKKLRKDYEEIADKVERGMLPLVARIPAIEKAVSEYVLAQDEDFERKREKGGHVPIQYRDNYMLDKFAELVMYEELTWSHPDKMSIVEYPVMSERQEKERKGKQVLKSGLEFGDLRYLGKRKKVLDDDGMLSVRWSRVIKNTDDVVERSVTLMDLQNALKNAGLTDRQRQAIDLVFFENMTQEEAGEVMGVTKQAVNRYISFAINKLFNYMK